MFHELGQLVGCGMGDFLLGVIDAKHQQGIFPVIEPLGYDVEQLVAFLDNDGKLGVDFTQLGQTLGCQVTSQLPDLVVINRAKHLLQIGTAELSQLVLGFHAGPSIHCFLAALLGIDQGNAVKRVGLILIVTIHLIVHKLADALFKCGIEMLQILVVGFNILLGQIKRATIQRVAKAHLVKGQLVIDILQHRGRAHCPVVILGIGQVAHAVVDNESDHLTLLNGDKIVHWLQGWPMLSRGSCWLGLNGCRLLGPVGWWRGSVIGWSWGLTALRLCACHALLARLLLLTFLAPLLDELATVMLDLPQNGLLVNAEQTAAFLGIDHTGYLIRNNGDGLDDVGDGGGALDGILLGILEDDAGLEVDEVLLLVLDILFDFIKAVRPDKGVGIVLGRQRQHFDIQALLEQHVHTSNGGLDTRGITVKHLGDIGGKTSDGMDVAVGQSGAR